MTSSNNDFYIRASKQLRHDLSKNELDLHDVFAQLRQFTFIENLPEDVMRRIAEELNQGEISSAALSGSALHGARQYRDELFRQYNLWKEFVGHIPENRWFDIPTNTLKTSFIENKLKKIDLKWYNEKTTEDDFRPLQNALSDPRTTVKSLKINFQKLKANGLVALANALLVNKQLEELELIYSGVCDIDEYSFTTVTIIGNDYERPESLPWYNPIGIQTLANSLEINTNIERLVLRGNSIGDLGAIALAGALRVNQGLKSLDISDNQIGTKGASEIAKALSNNSVLMTLNLASNPIGGMYSYQHIPSYDWTAIHALANALKQNVTLKHIDISYISSDQHIFLEEIGRERSIEIYVYNQ